ncbi:hypothetical protein [Nostoc sp. PCC 9305]|uniref:hypothetical protein n=1 Tax=Nostoc sp. PCC 9305 TaxID=296636 RepID=UPI0039C66CC1
MTLETSIQLNQQAIAWNRQYTGTMPKLPECDCCLLYSHNPHFICTVHPNGSVADRCLDFRENPNAEPVELWEPEGATYYNGELIVQPQQRWTQQQKLELLDWHPMFTGRCPQCSAEFDRDWSARVHWDCQNPECGWMDDTV